VSRLLFTENSISLLPDHLRPDPGRDVDWYSVDLGDGRVGRIHVTRTVVTEKGREVEGWIASVLNEWVSRDGEERVAFQLLANPDEGHPVRRQGC
jgi:hypothetical protein